MVCVQGKTEGWVLLKIPRGDIYGVGEATHTERQRKTTEKGERHRWGLKDPEAGEEAQTRWVPGAGPRVAFAENLRGQGSSLVA